MPRPLRRRSLATCVVGGMAVLAACSSGTSTSSPTSSTTVATATPTTAPSTTSSTSTTSTTSTTIAPDDPTFADTPESLCDTLVPGSIGFRNTTGHVADEYRRIGTSSEGRPIWSEHWGSRAGPQVLVLGQVHGDECAPAFMVRAIREQPPTDFGIWLVPTVNPDGLAEHTRRTAQGIDPNRDGFDLKTPEAQAVMDVTAAVKPVLTIHLHSPYKWVGAHNGPLATQVAAALTVAAGWAGPYNAGRVKSGTLAFLWEGQERVLPGAQSVLVEFPAISPLEAPDAPDPTQRQEGTVAEVKVAATQMRDALYAVMSTVPAPDAVLPNSSSAGSPRPNVSAA